MRTLRKHTHGYLHYLHIGECANGFSLYLDMSMGRRFIPAHTLPGIT